MPELHDDRRRISAALDGDGPMPESLDADGQAFLDAATLLRARVRIEEAATPPDVTDAVLARIRSEGHTGADVPVTTPRRPHAPLLLTAAVVFVLAAAVTAVLVRPGGLLGPEPARADVGQRVLAAQHRVTALDASLHLVERGAHPLLPERRYDGVLRYRSPERLWLQLDESTARPTGFPANDLELVIDEDVAWRTGLLGCPIGAQPECLGSPRSRVTTGLAPFAPDWVAPLDLVVPTGAFLPGAELPVTEGDDTVVLDTTVARLRHTIDGLRAAGALRDVHPTDPVRLTLDRRAFTIQRLTVRAGGSTARQAWAASNGYSDPSGSTVLDLTVTEGDLGPAPFPAPPGPSTDDAGFTATAVPAEPQPRWLPDDYVPGRHGTRSSGGPPVMVSSWSDGRGWIRVDATDQWEDDRIFGDLGPLVRRIDVGGGVGYVDPGGSIVALHTPGLDLAVTGSVPLDVLTRVAASLPVHGRPVPTSWPQGQVLDALPTGALRPAGALVARYDGPALIVAVPGPGQTSAVLHQRPGATLGLPGQADIIEVAVRGGTGRYDPRAGTIAWIEGGWVRELRSDGLGLDSLLATAAALEPA